MSKTNVRVEPLKSDELNDEQKNFLKPFSDKKGRYPNIFGTLARHMPLINAWSDFGLYTMRGSQIDPVLREVLVLRTSRNVECDYEWHHHQHIAQRLGMDEAVIDAIGAGETTGHADYDLLVRVADDLANSKKLTDEVWAEMVERFGMEYTMDAIFTCGAYTALAMGLNSCGVQIEGGGH